MTRMSPAESDSSLVSFGASLQFTFADRLWIRGCAVLVALLASTTALFAQANEFRSALPQPAPNARLNAAFAAQDDLFHAPDAEPHELTAETTATAPGQADTSTPKTPIRRDPEIATSAPSSPNSMSMVWVMVFALIAAAGGVSVWARRHPGIRARALPETVFQILGRQQIGPGQAVIVARLGERVLLLSSGSDGLRTLTQIDDLAEASRLTAECLASTPRSPRAPASTQRPVPPERVATAAFQVVGSRDEQLRAAISPVLNQVEADYDSKEILSRRDRISAPPGRERDHG